MRGTTKMPAQRGGNDPKFRKYAAFAKKFCDIIGLLESCPSGEDLPVTATRWKYLNALAKRRHEAQPSHSRNFENWWRGDSLPEHLGDLIDVLRAAAVANNQALSDRALNDLKAAATKIARPPEKGQQEQKGTGGQDKVEERPRGMRTRPISRPKRRRLANFSIDAPGQGHSKDDLHVYFDYLGGKEPIGDGLGWVAAKRVEVDFSAEDYTETDHLNRSEIKPSAGVWIITPKPKEPFIDGPLFEDRHDKPPLVRLVRNGDVTDPKPPEIRVFIPHGAEFLHVEPAGEAADAPEACKAVIAAFLKTAVTHRTLGIELGSATFVWDDQ